MAPRVRFDQLVAEGGRVQEPPKVGSAETTVNRSLGWIPGANRLTDAISAMALEAGSSGGVRATLTPGARAELQAMGEDVPEDPGLVDRYREVRDRRAMRTEAGAKQHPWAARFGDALGLGLSIMAPLPKASGAGLGAAVKTGAGYGAFQGLTEGGADLTRGEFIEGAADTLKGAAFGGGLGAGLHGAMRLGQRATQGLRNARQDVLAQETMAAREAAEQGQAAAAKAAEGERKVVGQAREMNKAFDKKRAKELVQRARGGDGARSPAGGAEEPGTKVLKGYSAQARQAQMSRSKEVERLQQKMNDTQYPTKVTEDWQAYIDEMPKAMEKGPQADPGGLRRQFMERHLRQKYGDEMAERLMRERIGPGGEILPRPTAPPASPADETTQLSDAFDAAARGEARAGGGGSAWSAYGADGKTIRALPEDLPGASAPTARQMPSPLTPPPAIREGATGMPYGKNLRPALPPPEPATQLATQSMAAPRDAPLPQEPTRAASVPNIQRHSPPVADVPTVPGRPALPDGASQPAAPAPISPPAVSDDIQDVTRLAGPEDVAPLAAERAALRERGGLGTLLKETAKGSAAGGDIGLKIGAMLGQPGKGAGIGALVGGGKALTTTILKDPAVRARVLAAARLHVLARINPALYARVGAQLQAGGHQRAAEHLLARKDPEYREARAKAAEQVAGMTDQQLVELFAHSNVN
jgi:hypothetical protein